MDLITDYDALDRERRIQGAMAEVRKKYGVNAIFKGMNMLKGATALERNRQIGGHRARRSPDHAITVRGQAHREVRL